MMQYLRTVKGSNRKHPELQKLSPALSWPGNTEQSGGLLDVGGWGGVETRCLLSKVFPCS